jgi:hypothetical protein
MRKSLIDNWSLEHAGSLLSREIDTSEVPRDKFILNIGGLTNYLHSLLYYDETIYLANGFEKDWTRFNWFEKNARLHLNGVAGESLEIDWKSEDSYTDQGIKNYLTSSEKLSLDLFVSPERATIIKEKSAISSSSNLETVFNKVDEIIERKSNSLWLKNTGLGIIENFEFPCLTQYVLSQATNIDDLLNVVVQLKESRRVIKAIQELIEISKSTKDSMRFQKEVENRINKAFGEKIKSDSPLTLKISAFFISINSPLDFNFFSRKEHLLFLKDIIACRTESGNLRASINRIFKQKL